MKSIRQTAGREGFTLVELLVVLGIIVLLGALLLPAVSRVRRVAAATATQNEMSVIAAACQAYFHDFNAYPGPVANVYVSGGSMAGKDPNAITGITFGNKTNAITSSENLVLGLLGMLTPPPPPNGKIQYTAPGAANSPHDVLSLNYLNPKSYHYIDYVSSELTPTPITSPATANLGQTSILDYVGGAATPTDSSIPEFIDTISSPMPILYVRANVGNPAVIGTGATAVTATNDETSQYNYTQFNDYGCFIRLSGVSPVPWALFSKGGLAGDYFSTLNSGPLASDVAAPYQSFDLAGVAASPGPGIPPGYFTNPNIQAVPRGKDSFILISAGTDRTYGTADDIIVTP